MGMILCKEVKDLVRQKELTMGKEVVEKVNRKNIWAFVGSRTKARNRGIAALKSVEGLSVTSAKILMMVGKGRSRVEWKPVVGCQ